MKQNSINLSLLKGRCRINLAVIFYGRAGSLKANEKQFLYLKNNLLDFKVSKYDFNKGERGKLLADFKRGEIDIALKNSYGRDHEAEIESFLELNKIPYLGSDAKSTFIGTSKYLSKQVFRKHKLPVVEDIYVDKKIWGRNKNGVIRNIIDEIGFPCLIKDIGGTDSRGIYKIEEPKKCKKLLNKAVAIHSGVIVEKFIDKAYEVICLAVGDKNPEIYAPLGLRKNNQSILTPKMKDNIESINFEIPAKLPGAMIKKIKKITKLTHQALHCRTFSRADVLVAGDKLYILEVDVHTGFSKNSAATVSARYRGESINELFLKLYKLSQKSYE